MLKKYYLGGFFWAPIPHKRYQNTSGFAAAQELQTSCFLEIKTNKQAKKVVKK